MLHRTTRSVDDVFRQIELLAGYFQAWKSSLNYFRSSFRLLGLAAKGTVDHAFLEVRNGFHPAWQFALLVDQLAIAVLHKVSRKHQLVSKSIEAIDSFVNVSRCFAGV